MARFFKAREPAENSEVDDLARLKQKMQIMDDRLDNIDSVLTAVAERIMKQPITINLTCPHCGKNIECALVGQQKPT
ncbi:MAG TPA: hypothetical protein VLH15_11870 [Dehalococcoidales bacterium]|nr:hypothetical protein [Dehalococcoidales bacterium]